MAYVVYETWKKNKYYLDDQAKALYQKIDKLLPQTESRIIDRDKNENVLVIRTFTDRQSYRNPQCDYGESICV